MYVTPELVPVKPFLSYAFVQGQEHRTLQIKGHTSLDAAKRRSFKAMRDLRDHVEGGRGRTEPVLMSWGYQKVEDHERERGLVL